MATETVLWCPRLRRLSIRVCVGLVLSGTALAQVPQAPPAQSDETQDGTTGSIQEEITANGERRVRLRLIDPNGGPVSGARVASPAHIVASSPSGKELYWDFGPISDENGQVHVSLWKKKKSFYILHEERRIGAVPEIPREPTGERPPIVLMPVCRVHGTLTAEEARAAGIPVDSMGIVVSAASTNTWLLTDGSPAEEKYDFGLLLPPGQYSLLAHGSEFKPGRGSYISNHVKFETRTITVTPGQRDLDLGTISFRPTKVWSLTGQPAPEIGPMKGWKNGSPVTLADLRGRVVWLDFSGRIPSTFSSLPWLARLHSTFADKGLTIIAIYNCDSMEELEREWAKDYERNRWVETQGGGTGAREVPFRVAIDGGEPNFCEGTEEPRRGDTYARYDITFPTSVLIDRAGNIVARPDSDKLEDTLSEMLGLPVEKPQPVVWQPRFHEVYRLDEGQIVRHIAPPFIPERTEYFKDKYKNLDLKAVGSPASLDFMIPSRVIFQWDGGLKEAGAMLGKGATDLKSILESVFRLKETEYEGPDDLLRLELPGDWILRSDSTLQERFLALEGIIANELGRRVRIEKRPVERSVIVVTGKFCLRSSPSSTEDSLVHVYSAEGEPEPGGSGRWMPNSIGRFVGMLSHRTKTVVIDRTEPAERTDDFCFYEHPSAWLREIEDTEEKERRLRLLLGRLEAQTQLHFEIRMEPLPTWCVTEQVAR
ncbi:MAG: TlpA disulfide reductase family protein [Phycisphaerales bacterium]